MTDIETDYLVIGAGAVGMAFVDVLLDETDADIVIVDRHHMPGGHWNDAYPFVRLHQPSAFYGVASTPLGSDRIDARGSNAGYYELAAGAEVLAYFEKVMRERFLPSGRVRYFPMANYAGDGTFSSLLRDDVYEVDVRRKTVDATFFNTSVPSTHQRQYAVGDGVACIAPNALPREAPDYRRFTIIGGGKTGMDAIVWLLDNHADPASITWICPRASWLIDRATTQPGMAFFEASVGGFAGQVEACAAAASVNDLFARMEACGAMVRVDPDATPTMFHYATISQGELAQLRRIRNVLRNGRIAAIEPGAIVFQNGERTPAEPETLYVDCTATAIQFSGEQQPVFQDDRIVLQSVRSPLLPFSAAVTACVEARFETDEEKNRLCRPVVLADTPAQWMQSFLGNLMNQFAWRQESAVNQWVAECRLDPFGKTAAAADRSDPAQAAIMARIRNNMMPAVENLQKLIAGASAAEA